MKYRCIKGFCLNECDDDGFSLDRTIDVNEGEVFKETNHYVIGLDVHLENDKKWIDIDKEMLNEYFEEVNQ